MKGGEDNLRLVGFLKDQIGIIERRRNTRKSRVKQKKAGKATTEEDQTVVNANHEIRQEAPKRQAAGKQNIKKRPRKAASSFDSQPLN